VKNRKSISVLAKLQRMYRDTRGVSMLEFALLLPLLVVIFIGTVEVSRLVLFHQKIDNATSRVADLVTRIDQDTVSCANTAGGLQWMRNTALRQSMAPYALNATTTLIVTSVRGEYPDPTTPNDNAVVRQRIEWQWRSGPSPSQFGAAGANLAANGNWPAPFRRTPNNGGMFDRDRVIAVEVYHRFEPLLTISPNFLPIVAAQTISKRAFYRARFGNMGTLGC